MTLAERWNGKRWVVQSTPNPAQSLAVVFDKLVDVSCGSATSCFAVGYNDGGAFVERWNGRRWSVQVTLPHAELRAVSCSSPVACTVVGGGDQSATSQAVVMRWNGKRWASQQTPARVGSELLGVSCPSQTACTAVGYSVTPIFGPALAMRWDGKKWSLQQTAEGFPGSRAVLFAVSCPTRRACIALGGTSVPLNAVGPPIAEAWNGIRWTVQHIFSGSSSEPFTRISCDTPTACIAVGGSRWPEFWNGKRWFAPHLPRAFFNLVGVACASQTVCTAVGSSDANGPLIMDWHGRM